MWGWMVVVGVALGASEMPYDGVDQDGDGVDLVDVDGDGYASALAFGPDCDDRDDRVHPGARDVRGDGIDADCDGDTGDDRTATTDAALVLLGLAGLVTARRVVRTAAARPRPPGRT